MSDLIGALTKTESNNNPKAVSNNGAVGIAQIKATGGALDDWNMYHKKQVYGKKDLLNKDINLKIAKWYLNKRIPQMLKAYNLPDTTRNRLWAYNAGIGNVRKGIMPEETKNYISKIEKLLKEE